VERYILGKNCEVGGNINEPGTRIASLLGSCLYASSVNLYISKLRGILLARQPASPAKEILSPPSLELACQFVYRGAPNFVWRSRKSTSAMLTRPVRKSTCQFVYRKTLGASCVGHGTLEGQFKERGSDRWKHVNP
jgi:hypothetical protein